MKKEYFENFNLAEFIAEERCVVCGQPKTLNKTPEVVPDETRETPPEFPIMRIAKEFFFLICPKCRKRVFNGLCVACTKELGTKDSDFDYFVLAICQKFAEEYIRIKSELTKWTPKIQAEMRKSVSISVNPDLEKQRKLLKRIPRK